MQQFINDLVLLGLTENEANTYMLLLKKAMSATHIAQTIGVNRSNVYGVLANLTQKGFVREVNGKVRTYVGVNPKIAFDVIKTKCRMHIKLMDKLSETLQPFFEADKKTAKREFIKILHSKSSITQTLEKLEAQAQEEVLAFSKPPYLMNVADLDTLNLPQRESAAKGVKYRAIHELEPDNLEQFTARMKYFASMGEEVRIAKKLPLKLFIFDGTIAVFTMESDPDNLGEFTFTSFEHTDVAQTFIQIFNQYWENAQTLDAFLAMNPQ